MSEQLHPRVNAELGQGYLNETLPKLMGDIALWQLRLDMNHGDIELQEKVAQAAIDTLDNKWPFKDNLFIVCGSWQELNADDEPENTSIFQLTQSDGFAVGHDINSNEPFIGLRFYSKSRRYNNIYREGLVHMYAVARPQEISLDYVGKDVESLHIQPEQIRETLVHYSQVFTSFTNKPDFYTAKHTTQQQFVKTVLEKTNEILTAPSCTTRVMVSSPFVYKRIDIRNEEGFSKVYESGTSESDIQLAGNLMGVTVMEKELLDSRPIRSQQEWIDSSVTPSLMAIIEVDSTNSSLITHGQPIFVPISHVNALAVDSKI